jgi:putative transposase
MSEYRRNYVEGGTFFFTVVTHRRRRFLTSDLSRECMRSALVTVQNRFPFQIVAMVLLPDHLHAVLTLPRGDADYSVRWKRIKEEFTRTYLANGGEEGPISDSRHRKGERGVWHRRYWEHTCIDEEDMKARVDYTHYNPVKHGYVSRVGDYPWSTFHRFVAAGEYEPDWGTTDPAPGIFDAEWDGDWC